VYSGWTITVCAMLGWQSSLQRTHCM